jgi:hypothetical protein
VTDIRPGIMTGIYCVKTTGERVFVLKTEEDKNTFNTIVTVRRPIVGKNGLYHSIEQFRVDELETVNESLDRDLAEMILKGEKQAEALKKARKEAEANDAVPVSLLN